MQGSGNQQENVREKTNEAEVFLELIEHIENSVENGVLHFKLVELRTLYEHRLHDLGIGKEINKVCFRDKMLKHFPNAQVQFDGKFNILIFEEGMQQLLKSFLNSDYEGDALVLAKASKILRHDLFDTSGKFQFNASFPPGCQENSVPHSLKFFTSMLLYGLDIVTQQSNSQCCLTVSQMILFNCKKKESSSKNTRHSLDFEPPLPLYIGLNSHTQSRSKKMITELCDLGLSPSYDRILKLETQLANAVCEHMENTGVVCPPQLRHDLFTVGALDNIDHNPSSTTATDSFHGTGISLFQFPTKSSPGRPQPEIDLKSHNSNEKFSLPDSYTVVPAVALDKTQVTVPEVSNDITSFDRKIELARDQESNWLRHASNLLDKEMLDTTVKLAWSAYHASFIDVSEERLPALTELLPLFVEKAATAAMIKHGLEVIRKSTKYLNPGQIPVVAMDAPLYALAKYVQWKWPQSLGEDKYVIMFGGLHIEMAIWKTFGDFLEGSGWTNALTQAGVATSGTADSFLKSSHVTRTRHAHQVTALSLAELQHRAYIYSNTEPHTEEGKKCWINQMIKASPTFQYWDTVLRLEILCLIFVRAHREADSPLYIETLKALVPWFFGLDHFNYARWIPIHIRNMESLPPPILAEFVNKGHWVVAKTMKRFSAMPIDQAHEQNNERVKGSGGAVGLTENPSAFRKWMVAGPEHARILKEFETEYFEEKSDDFSHHEEGQSTQYNFKNQVVHLTDIIAEMGNPFLGESTDMVVLDTRDIMGDAVAETIRTIESLGKQQYEEYTKSVIVDRTRSINTTIKKNNLPLFKFTGKKDKTKTEQQNAMLKSNLDIFSQLFIVMQQREADMDVFFKHENNPTPPALSDNGKLRSLAKSDLIKCLVGETQAEPPTLFDAKVLDGAAVVHMLSLNAVGTFIEYANRVFLPYIVRQLESCQRIDVVWDTYLPNSIKESTREKRGKGVRRKVLGKNKIPGNWNAFLCDPKNKQELFSYLSDIIATADLPIGKVAAITIGQKVAMNGGVHLMEETCDHEEADTRILVHLQHALQHGATTCLVRTVDTDVLVILIGKFSYLLAICPSAEIWVAFGTGKDFKYISLNAVAQTLGIEMSTSLPVFHSLTGCDTVSSFFGRGKKTAWQAWKSYKEVTEAFMYIASNPFEMLDVASKHFKQLERYCIILYDKTSSLTCVNDARKELFCKGNKTMENLPPTQDALVNHTKRALYQAGIWTSSHKSMQHVPSPADWGWIMDDDGQKWVPVWRTLENATVKVLAPGGVRVSVQGGVSALSFADATVRINA